MRHHESREPMRGKEQAGVRKGDVAHGVGTTQRTTEERGGQSARGVTAGESDRLPELFDAAATARFQEQWNLVQSGFVDDPSSAVAKADALVDEVIRAMTQGFLRARQELETKWDGAGEVSTEDLRRCLMRYRSFFHRLLTAYSTESGGRRMERPLA